MTAELRRYLVLALVGLLGGFGLIVVMYGSAEMLKRSLVPTEQGSGTGEAADGAGARPAISGEGGTLAPQGTPEAKSELKAQGSPQPGKPGAAVPDAKAEADAKAPSFDLVRVEPTGETVVAGRGLPNTVVEMLVNGKPVAKALADPNGQFALVPPALLPGDSEIVLRLIDPQGREVRSPQSVAVVVSPDRKTRPLVALSSPDSPTVVLSQPEALVAAPSPNGTTTPAKPAPGSPKTAGAASPSAQSPLKAEAGKPGMETSGAVAGQTPSGAAPAGTADAAARTPPALKIVSVDAQEGGRLYVTGQAAPGATVRLYLNDTLVAPASVGPDGKVVFTIGKGVAAGNYRVRIDQVDPVTGKVRTRAETAFSVPESAARVASREPAGEAARPGTGDAAPAAATPGRATTAAPPSALKPGTGGSPAGEPRMAAGASTGPKLAPGPSDAAAAPPPNRPAVQAGGADPRSPEGPAGKPSAAGPADALAKASGMADSPPSGAGSVFVAEIATARIARGDNLWQISRKIYGKGMRYTVIYDANQDQIRDPDKIFPGQIFVLPRDGTAAPG